MIKATKNGIERNFSEKQWHRMPRNKYGWSQIVEVTASANVVPSEIVQKKIVAGSAAAVSDVPEEIIIKKLPEAPKIEPELKSLNVEDDKALPVIPKKLVHKRKRVVKKSK